MRRSVLASLLPFLVLATHLSAEVIEVPGDFEGVQDAIDAAQAGDTIVVEFDVWSGPFVITRPLTIVGGSTMPYFRPGGAGSTGELFVLDGPGKGTVVFSNVIIGAQIGGNFEEGAASITGGGFEALHIYDSVVQGSPWSDNMSFVRPGVDAIDVSVPLVWIERSEIRGGDTDNYDAYPHSQGFDAGHGLVTTGTAVVIDSLIDGGNGTVIRWDGDGCPQDCPGGDGGDGIVCDQLISSNSTFDSGFSSSWDQRTGGVWCCRGESGIAMQTQQHLTMDQDLTGSGMPQLGNSYTLDWTIPGSTGLLFFAVAPRTPEVARGDLWCLGASATVVAAVASPSNLTLDLPVDPVWTGTEFVFQIMTSEAISRPLAGTLVP